MDYNYKKLDPLKWMSFPLGLIMLGSIWDIFGIFVSTIISIIAALIFYTIVVREQTRQAGLEFTEIAKDALKKTGDMQSYVEVRKNRYGIVARVYLIGAKSQVKKIYNEIVKNLENSRIKDDIIAMQVTDVEEHSRIGDARSRLNRQLMEEIKKQSIK